MDMKLPEDPQALKGMGVMVQKDGLRYTVRLCGVAGEWSAGDLAAVADLAERHAAGGVHLTVRQGMEIPDVPPERLASLLAGLSEAGIRFGGSGPRVRGVVACPGGRCRRGLIDSAETARALAEAVGGRENLPHKFKIAVTGCASRCVKPQENDFGVQGTPDGGYMIYVGGHMGRSAELGDVLDVEVAELTQLQRAAKATIDWFCEHAHGKERLGTVIGRVGIDSLAEAVAGAVGGSR